MLEILITAAMAFIVAFLAIPVVMLIADKKKLYDIPDERKLHSHAIASLGGVGIFLGFVFSVLVGIKFSLNPEFQYFLAAVFVIFFIGLKDDIIQLSATKKLVAQILVAGLIIHLGGIRIENMFGIAGVYNIQPSYGIPLTYITIILITNAFNLIDGIDGLSGSLGLMISLLFGSYFLIAGLQNYAVFAFALSASLAAFLIFNFPPAKIFMGDCGSLLVGTVASILALKFINTASVAPSPLQIPSALALAIAVLIVPLVDTLRVFAIRIVNGRSPFSPDRNHVHHLLIDRGLTHTATTLICVGANIVIVAAVFLFRDLGNTILITTLFTVCFIVLGLLYSTLPKRKLVVHRRFMNKTKYSTADISAKPRVINLNLPKEPVEIEQIQG